MEPLDLSNHSLNSLSTSYRENPGAVTFEREPLKAGEDLEVIVPDNVTTGYQWEIEEMPEELVSVLLDRDEAYTSDTPADKRGELVGGGGSLRILLRAEETGAGTIKLRNTRVWERKDDDLRVTVVLGS